MLACKGKNATKTSRAVAPIRAQLKSKARNPRGGYPLIQYLIYYTQKKRACKMISYLYPDKFNNRATAAANNNPRTCCFFVILSVFCVPRNLDINSLNAVVHYYHDNGEHDERAADGEQKSELDFFLFLFLLVLVEILVFTLA